MSDTARLEPHAASRAALSNWARRWCRSPATTCRCSTPPASWRSTSTAAAPPACSTSRTWARCGSTAPTPRPRSRRSCPGDVTGLAPMRTRYSMFTLDDGGIIDDLMVTNAGDHLFLVVNAGGKDGDIAHMRARIGAACEIEPLERSRAAGAAGAAGRRGAGAPGARGAPDDVHELRDDADRRHRVLRHALRLHRRGRLRDLRSGRQAERFARRTSAQPEVKPAASARAICCGWKRACASTATTSTARPRRSRRISAGRIRKRRRAAGGFPGAEAHPRRAGQRPEAAARRNSSRRPRAGARGHTKITDAQRARDRRDHQRRLRPHRRRPGGDGLCRARLREPGTAVQLVVRDVPRPAKVVAMPVVPHRYFKG